MGVRSSQYALVIINAIFALFGLTLFILGCMIKFGSENIEDYIIDKLSGTLAFMRSAGSEGNLVNFDLGQYLGTLAMALISTGAFFLVVSFFGCCGGIGKIRCFLIFYSCVVILLILMEVAVVISIVAFHRQVKEVIRQPMLTSLKNEYQGINSSDVISAGWNYLMIVFKCCGVDNWEDFQSANEWQRKVSLPGEPINGSVALNQPPITALLTTPVACCKSIGSFPQISLPEKNNLTCALSPNVQNSNMGQGCLNALETYLKEHNIYIITGAGIMVLSEIIMLLLVFCLLQAMKRKRNFDKELQRMFQDE